MSVLKHLVNENELRNTSPVAVAESIITALQRAIQAKDQALIESFFPIELVVAEYFQLHGFPSTASRCFAVLTYQAIDWQITQRGALAEAFENLTQWHQFCKQRIVPVLPRSDSLVHNYLRDPTVHAMPRFSIPTPGRIELGQLYREIIQLGSDLLTCRAHSAFKTSYSYEGLEQLTMQDMPTTSVADYKCDSNVLAYYALGNQISDILESFAVALPVHELTKREADEALTIFLKFLGPMKLNSTEYDEIEAIASAYNTQNIPNTGRLIGQLLERAELSEVSLKDRCFFIDSLPPQFIECVIGSGTLKHNTVFMLLSSTLTTAWSGSPYAPVNAMQKVELARLLAKAEYHYPGVIHGHGVSKHLLTSLTGESAHPIDQAKRAVCKGVSALKSQEFDDLINHGLNEFRVSKYHQLTQNQDDQAITSIPDIQLNEFRI